MSAACELNWLKRCYIGMMEKKMETIGIIGVLLGLYRDDIGDILGVI